MVLAGSILPNGTFLGMVKVHGKSSEAHLVVAEDWATVGGYRQSPNGEAGNLFNASYHPPDGILILRTQSCCAFSDFLFKPDDGVGGRVEDPSEPWQDERGHWHVLFHAESPSGAPWPRSGGHAFSCALHSCSHTSVLFPLKNILFPRVLCILIARLSGKQQLTF
jgi:hypothetical protein